ncbi:MAG: methyltransferase domain-containing protein [Alphaproteobacteria bacterium]|nr:methyltransferase domain-containing protein [Alphaproteobacteria bacterium]
MSKETGKGARALKVRVKTAKGRTTGSKRWLERQLNDPYVAAAKKSGYRSRAAFKLAEIDAKYRLLKPGARVLDLGAAPGGWTQVALEKIGRAGRVVGIDLQPMEAIPGAILMQLDFNDADAPDRIREALDGEVDVVLSDMAAPATGHKATDHMRIMALCDLALDLALEVLRPGGAFLAKVLRGGTERDLLARMKQRFESVHHVKPPASRADSSEMYVLAMGFKAERA